MMDLEAYVALLLNPSTVPNTNAKRQTPCSQQVSFVMLGFAISSLFYTLGTSHI